MKNVCEFTCNGKPALIDLDSVLLILHFHDDQASEQRISIFLAGGHTLKILADEAKPIWEALCLQRRQPTTPSGP
jgi:hypothetical protein